jgi:hypothetical protein
VIGILVLALLAAADDGAVEDGAIDQRVRLSPRADAIEVELRVQLGRQAAFSEVLQIDADRDGRLSPEEQARYFAALEETVRSGLELRVDGRDVPLRRSAEMRLEMPFRKIYRFEAAVAGGGRVEFHNENFTATPGKATLVLEPEQGLDALVEGDPENLRRDVVCDLRPGRGRVERRTAAPSGLLPAPPDAAVGLVLLLRALALVGLGVGTLLAWRRRRRAAFLALAAAGAFAVASIVIAVPSAEEAERIFLALHDESARAADASLRRVKPLETRILPSLGAWGPEYRVRHRWAAYGTVSHSGHGHADVRETEGRFVVRWTGGAWRLVAL